MAGIATILTREATMKGDKTSSADILTSPPI